MKTEINPGAFLLKRFALNEADNLVHEVERVAERAPFRHLTIPGGKTMSVGMTNCGQEGWYADQRGYRYTKIDPLSGMRWPGMPGMFLDLAIGAAIEAGYKRFVPDACLINRYEPGTKLSLHQDKDEGDFSHPIVSVSLGLTAIFQFGGQKRSDPVRGLSLTHGDVIVFGGESRLCYHGILPIRRLSAGDHPLGVRYNLTFRRTV